MLQSRPLEPLFERQTRSGLTTPSSGRPKGRFAPFGPPLMSNVRPLAHFKGACRARSVLQWRAAQCLATGSAPVARAKGRIHLIARSSVSARAVRPSAAGEPAVVLATCLRRSPPFSVPRVSERAATVGAGCPAVGGQRTARVLREHIVRGPALRAALPPSQPLLMPQCSRTLAAMKASTGASPAAIAAARKRSRASNSQASNPSIERTNNSGRHLLASARSAALLFAAHVER